MLRKLLAVLGGVFMGIFIVRILGTFISRAYPMPESIDPYDNEAYVAFVHNLPQEMLVLNILSHAIAALLAAFVAARIADNQKLPMGLMAGMVLFAFVLMTLFMVPYPKWVLGADVALVLFSGWIGAKLGS